MKVTEATISQVAMPLERPFRSGIHDIRTIFNVVVELHVGDHVGIGYTFAFHKADSDAVLALTKDLATSVLGKRVDEVRTHWSNLWGRINFAGHEGVPVMAVAAVDIALWDAHARNMRLPLDAVLGARGSEWPVYASGGSLDLSQDLLVAEATRAQERGYAAFKCRVGSPELGTDFDRVSAVRAAVGDDFPLMVDANQAWSRREARRACQALAEFNLAWVEEPILADDVIGLAELRASVEVPIAAGETAYGVRGNLELLRADAVDYLQPDLMRCGGITPFLDVASLASAHHVAVMPHLFAETCVHLMGLLPPGAMIEYLPGWFDHLFGPPDIRGGRLQAQQSGGLGVRLDSAPLAPILTEVVQLDRRGH